MASKRAIRRRSCSSKVRHESAQDAQRAIGFSHHKFGYQGFMTAYPCQFCGGWHIGHPPKMVRQAIRAARGA